MQSPSLLQNSKKKRILGLQVLKLIRIINFTYIYFNFDALNFGKISTKIMRKANPGSSSYSDEKADEYFKKVVYCAKRRKFQKD